MEDMNWQDIKEAIAKGYTTVVVGIGSTEQHGLHLPTKTDALIGDAMAHGVAEKLGNALQAQTIRVGCSEHHLAFPGTISLRSTTLKAVIHDYVSSLEKHGFKTFILLPSHGGNFAAVKEAADELKKKYSKLEIIGYSDLHGFMDYLFKISEEFGISKEEAGAHAGETETSLILFLEEELVKQDRFTPGYLGPLGEKQVKIILERGMPTLSEKGILGDPTKASSKKGGVYLEKIIDFLAKEIKKQM
jgi:creatinine amidohydrolase